LALAYSAPESWIRFLAIDLVQVPLTALAIRGRDLLAEQRIDDQSPGKLAELARMLKINHVLMRVGHSAGELVARYRETFPEAVVSGRESIANGARRYAGTLIKGDGVWHQTGEITKIRSTRHVSYDIRHPRHAAFDLNEDTLATVIGNHGSFLVIDEEVNVLYGQQIRVYANERLGAPGQIVVKATERAKTLRHVNRICRAAVQSGLARRGYVVGVGGGITLDMAGLSASLLRRGVGYIRVPTTLVGLVDVSVGIKHGVNAFNSKNIIGSFYPPTCSVNDYSFLRTVSARTIASGAAEIVKMALVRDGRMLQDMERHAAELVCSRWQAPTDVAARIALRAELLMMEELAPNLFEEDLARVVDFGHTFSSTLETFSCYQISHGEAVALDMLLSIAIGVYKQISDPLLLDRVARLLDAFGLPLWSKYVPPPQVLLASLNGIIRQRGGSLNLVIPTVAGSTAYSQEVSLKELEFGMRAVQQLAAKAVERPIVVIRTSHESIGV
jgi:3-dehydroquinate synthetase